MRTLIQLCCLAAASFWLAACNKVDQAAAPAPQPVQVSNLRLATDSDGTASLSLSALGLSRRAPFTLQASGFRYGQVVLTSDSTIAYRKTSQTNWPQDSGTVHVCQGGSCVDQPLVVRNSAYEAQAEHPTCEDLGLVRTVSVARLSSDTWSNLPGLTESGAKLDSLWGYLYLAEIKDDSVRIGYGAVGGLAAGYNLGADEVHYRVRRPGGGCYTGTVRVLIPDTCTYPQARPDAVTAPAGIVELAHSQVYANDTSCSGQVPANAVLRLSFEDYTPPRYVMTRYGKVVDTLIGGRPSFYYQRTDPAARRDTILYYLQEGDEDRITRSAILLDLP